MYMGIRMENIWVNMHNRMGMHEYVCTRLYDADMYDFSICTIRVVCM